MKFLTYFSLLIMALTFIHCGGSGPIGSERITETSKDKPDWVDTPTSETDAMIMITGEMTKAADRSFGMNQAYADGVRKLLNTMQNSVKTQSSQALRGANVDEDDIGRFSEFAVAWLSDTYKVSGIKNPETFWEKVEVKTNSGVKYHYNCYSLLTISRTDYFKAIEGAYDEMRKKARAENNKKAEETATGLIEEIKKQQ